MGQQIVRRAVADGAGRSGRLVDVLVVEHGLRSPGGLLVEIMLPAEAPDVAPIVASKSALVGSLLYRGASEAVGEKIDRCAAERHADSIGICAPALKRVGNELIEREPRRQVGGELVFNGLERHPIIGRDGIGSEGVECLRVEPAVADVAVAAHVAHEYRAFGLLIPPADERVVVHVAEAAALESVSRAVDLIAAPQTEIDRAAGRVIAEHRRRRPAVDVDGSIGVRVDEVGAGEAVRLRHRKPVLEHHDIAHAESVAGIRAADRNADVARAVSLLEGHAGAFLQQILDGEGGRVLDALAADRGDGLSRRLRQRAGPPVGSGRPLRCGRCGRLRRGGSGCRRRARRGGDGRDYPPGGGCAHRRRGRRRLRPRGRHHNFGNADRGRCRFCRRARLRGSGSRWLGVRLRCLVRFGGWRRRLLRSTWRRNQHGSHQKRGQRQHWQMFACSESRVAQCHYCVDGGGRPTQRG
jgi:hypothetical protein